VRRAASRQHGRAQSTGARPGRRRRRLADRTRSRGGRSGLRTDTEDRSARAGARVCSRGTGSRHPVSCLVAVNESSTRVARVAAGASSQLLPPILRSNGQRQHHHTSRGRDQHRRRWGENFFRWGEPRPRPSCRQSREAELLLASPGLYPFPVQKGGPIRRSYGSIETCIRVEACGVEKESSFFRTATNGDELRGRTCSPDRCNSLPKSMLAERATRSAVRAV
jgi:hypothetical protein